MNTKIETGPLQELYDLGELAILFDWLELSRPEWLADLEHEWQDRTDGDDEARGPIRLRPSDSGRQNIPAGLSNAVARLVLSGIQNRLPQWAVGSGDGHMHFAREYTGRRNGQVEPLPRFLFGINWADSGPGFSWPEDYYATYLPGFDIYVITASQDSPDVHGYTDEAIGTAPTDLPVATGAKSVVQEWWQSQADYGQYRWEYVWTEGEISSGAAKAWADEIWDEETGEPLGRATGKEYSTS